MQMMGMPRFMFSSMEGKPVPSYAAGDGSLFSQRS
jgi:hypothetical protein